MTLEALFSPGGIAVIGASTDPAKLGAALARSVAGFPGYVGLVNARRPDPSAGVYGSVAEAAEHGPVDLALVCVPAAGCADAVAEAAKAGARAAVVYGGGFAEAGPDGERYQRELAEAALRTGIRLLGPNTSGFLRRAVGGGLTASFVPGAADVPAGRIAVVAASGGVNHALAFLLREAGHGVSLAVGLGNSADVQAADVLDHLADDPHTTAVALHIESVADGRRLTDAVARLTATRPVVALVVGRHDVGAFAASHTGALATSWRTTRAVLAQAGAVLVDDERELVDAVGALSLVRLPSAAVNPGVGVVTAQAGPGLLLLDDLRGRRATLPELAEDTRRALAAVLPPLTYQANPVDTGRPGPGFAAVLTAVAADPAVDLVAGYALHEPGAFDLVAAVEAARGRVPMVLGVGGAGDDVRRVRRALLDRGVPVTGDPHGLAAMTGALLADARGRSRTTAVPAAAPRVDVGPGPWDRSSTTAVSAGAPRVDVGPGPWDLSSTTAVSAGAPPEDVGPGPWDEDQAKTLLAALGVPTMPRRVCADRAQAHRALAELPGPVAVKLLDAAVLHKTEVGGVRLGVRTPEELDAALDAIEAAGASRYLVESMAPPGVDLVVGARRDPVFGPVVLVGLGGTTAEALADVSIRLAPLSAAEAGAMPAELAGHALLDGWRGGPVLDRAALGEVVSALGDLLAAHRELSEIEINPLRITAQGLVALDAVCIAAETAEPAEPAEPPREEVMTDGRTHQ